MKSPKMSPVKNYISLYSSVQGHILLLVLSYVLILPFQLQETRIILNIPAYFGIREMSQTAALCQAPSYEVMLFYVGLGR